MADQPELVGGNQNDQAAQPSATNQNDQRVQKKQKTEDMLKQNETLKADCAGLEKKLAYANGKLDQLKEDMELTRETITILKQTVETQYLMINMLEQQYFLFGMIPDNMLGTEEAGLPVHYPPAFQSGTAMGSGDPAIEESLGIPQGWAHGNNNEQLPPANDDQFRDANDE